MKKCLILLMLLAATVVSAKELKVLAIGNSFSLSVLKCLPKIVEDSGKHKLKFATTYIGGCPIERHLKNLENEKTHPERKPYGFYVTGQPKTSIKLSDAIKSDKWDIITIQQASPQSPLKEKTHADAAKLIAAVRELAPQAEIVVHQTWSYRADHWFFLGGKKKYKDQNEMYDRIDDNYKSLAAKYGFRLIPVGDAVQNYRANLPPFTFMSKEQLFQKLKEDKTYDAACGDVVGKSGIKVGKDGKEHVSGDLIHLNAKGNFLQGCVWYMFLFDEPADAIKYNGEVQNKEALIKAAEKAINDLKK